MTATTRGEIGDLGGLARRTPVLAFFMLLFTLSSIGVPGLNGFAGEFLLLSGAFQRGWTERPRPGRWPVRVIAVVAVSGVILGAWYMLWLVQRVFFGPLREPKHGEPHVQVRDLHVHEICALVPLAVFVFWIGLVPQHFLRRWPRRSTRWRSESPCAKITRAVPAVRPLLAGRAQVKGVARVD